MERCDLLTRAQSTAPSQCFALKEYVPSTRAWYKHSVCVCPVSCYVCARLWYPHAHRRPPFDNASPFVCSQVSPIVSNAPINAIVFGVERSISRDLADNPRGMAPIMQHMFAGMIAGAAQCVVASPAEQVKVLLQVERGSANPLYKGPVDCTKYIVRNPTCSLSRG